MNCMQHTRLSCCSLSPGVCSNSCLEVSDAIWSSLPLLPSSPFVFNSYPRTFPWSTPGKHTVFCFFFFWLCWVFVEVCGLSLIVTHELLLWRTGSRVCWFSSCDIQAYLPWSMWDCSFPTRDRTWVPCIGKQILYHWTTRGILTHRFLISTDIAIPSLLAASLLVKPVHWACFWDSTTENIWKTFIFNFTSSLFLILTTSFFYFEIAIGIHFL